MRYLVFAYDKYYPMGGTGDLRFKTNNREDAYEEFKIYREKYDYAEVYDCETGEVIF